MAIFLKVCQFHKKLTGKFENAKMRIKVANFREKLNLWVLEGQFNYLPKLESELTYIRMIESEETTVLNQMNTIEWMKLADCSLLNSRSAVTDRFAEKKWNQRVLRYSLNAEQSIHASGLQI